LDAALNHLAAGLCVLPAELPLKKPALSTWKQFQEELPKEEYVREWFAVERPLCIVTGASSGNLEMLDFDTGGEAFPPWCDLVEQALPGLVGTLPIERSMSGGFHVPYRLEGAVPGSMALAQREVEVDGPDPVTFHGKTYTPRQRDGRYLGLLTLIETRGTGGLFVCHPTEGYVLQQGSFQSIPLLSMEQRDVLIESARALNELLPQPEPVIIPSDPCGRPGDDFNQRGSMRELLIKHGWTFVRGGENEYWRRPGKSIGVSATLKDRVFYVFSSNAPPFDPNQAYAPFAVYSLLEHGGDYSRAASALRAAGYGEAAAGADPQVSLDSLLSSLKSGRPLAPGESHAAAAPLKHDPPSVRQLVAIHPHLREPVIHKLLRKGETMNLIAAPKTGKSWLASDLAIAVATGRYWLESFLTLPGDVLIVDNELHPQTSADRIPKMALARGIPAAEYDQHVFVENLRGRLRDIHSMGAYFSAIDPGRYKMIVLDAFYRFLPRDTDENDNGAMANIYNQLDWVADCLRCSFVLIHHASKGSQSGKLVTDVGAGAGAQSRATDTHVVLRPHEEPGCVVLEAAVRSWPPVEPRCLRWNFPVWTPDDTLDPTALKPEHPRRRPKSDSKPEAPEQAIWNSERFAAEFVGEQPQSVAAIVDAAIEAGLSERKAGALLHRAEARGLVHRWSLPDQRRRAYASIPAPAETIPTEATMVIESSKREAVLAMLDTEPNLSNREIARRCRASHEFVRKLRNELPKG
jgi:hypothetical protein